jgi:antitoxin VapB
VVLSARPGARTWDEFFALMESVEVPESFMAERPLNAPPPERPLFADDEL